MNTKVSHEYFPDRNSHAAVTQHNSSKPNYQTTKQIIQQPGMTFNSDRKHTVGQKHSVSFIVMAAFKTAKTNVAFLNV